MAFLWRFFRTAISEYLLSFRAPKPPTRKQSLSRSQSNSATKSGKQDQGYYNRV